MQNIKFQDDKQYSKLLAFAFEPACKQVWGRNCGKNYYEEYLMAMKGVGEGQEAARAKSLTICL